LTFNLTFAQRTINGNVSDESGVPEAEILKVNDPSILPQNPGY
tara:strand:+ start:256 stop:384 length:129 start_codon:yes stop_codon:yes gene_type:complete